MFDEFIKEFEQHLQKDRLTETDYLNKLYDKLILVMRRKYKILITKNKLNNEYQYAVDCGKVERNMLFESMTMIRPSRSNSGELELTTILPPKSISCQYDCAYCPNEPGVARSYLSSEGTPRSGMIEDFCSVRQTIRRLIQLQWTMNHNPDKILHIILGGTFHSYDKKVIEEYICGLYYACNIYSFYFDRYTGKYKSLVMDWFEGKPFQNHTSIESFLQKIDVRQMESLEQEKLRNTNGITGRITGVVIETRPDQINLASIRELRRYGVTRVQLGIQHTDNNILKIINREHRVEASIKSIQILKDNGFKVDGHIMPDLPGSSVENDVEMMKKVFQSCDFQLDYVKIYMCLDVPFTKIRQWKETAKNLIDTCQWKIIYNILDFMRKGDFAGLKEYNQRNNLDKDTMLWLPNAEYQYEKFLNGLVKGISMIPPWTRLNRFQRDFPKALPSNKNLGYESDFIQTNHRQICMELLKERGVKCHDIREREIRKRCFSSMDNDSLLYIRQYNTNNGLDYFISVEIPLSASDIDDAVLLGHVRLRISSSRKQTSLLKIFQKEPTLLVRELHVYGNLQMKNQKGNSQHRGIGEFLMKISEFIAQKHGVQQIAVISGVGVQNYYKRFGYDIAEDDYMVKKIESFTTQAVLFGRTIYYNDFEKVFNRLPDKTYPCGVLFILNPNNKQIINLKYMIGLLSVLFIISLYYYF